MPSRPLRTLPLLLALLASPAIAQSYSDPGTGAGAEVEWSRGRAGSGGLTAGAHVRARLTGGIAVEGLAAWRRETRDAGGEEVLKLTEVPVQASALLFLFFRSPVQPYLLGGIGYYFVRAVGEGSNADYGGHTESKFGFHGGAGVEARVAPRVSAFADVRYVSIDVDAVRALEARYGVSGRGDFWHAAAGVTLYF